MTSHNLHKFELEDYAHDYYGRGSSFDIWHIVGIVLGIILLLAIIGFIWNCIRNGGFSQTYGVHGAPGQVYY